jgi:hypothetical protein
VNPVHSALHTLVGKHTMRGRGGLLSAGRAVRRPPPPPAGWRRIGEPSGGSGAGPGTTATQAAPATGGTDTTATQAAAAPVRHRCEDEVTDEQAGGLYAEEVCRDLAHRVQAKGCAAVVRDAKQRHGILRVRCPVQGCELDAHMRLNDGPRGQRIVLIGVSGGEAQARWRWEHLTFHVIASDRPRGLGQRSMLCVGGGKGSDMVDEFPRGGIVRLESGEEWRFNVDTTGLDEQKQGRRRRNKDCVHGGRTSKIRAQYIT